MDNSVLLKAYHAKLVPYLVKIFDTDETAMNVSQTLNISTLVRIEIPEKNGRLA